MEKTEGVVREYINTEKDQFIRVLRPDSRNMGDISCPEVHVHDEIEMIYIFEGSMTVTIEESHVNIGEGDLLFINSFATHYTKQTSPEARACICQFSLEAIYNEGLAYLSSFLNNTDVTYYKFRTDERDKIERIVQNMLVIDDETQKYLKNNEKGSLSQAFLRKGNFYILFGLLCSEGLFDISKDDKSLSNQKAIAKVNTVLKYIREHYNEEITVGDAAELINVNASYFCRLFKKATGKTFIQYINYTRVIQAKQKLLNGDSTITDIMYETGFSSYSYFNRIFKQYSGYSPTEYKVIFQKKKQ